MREKFRSPRARRAGLAAAAALAVAVAAAEPATAASSASAAVFNDTLVVTATNADEVVALRLAPGQPGTLDVDFGDDGGAEWSFDRATFSRVQLSMRGGDDRVRVDQSNGSFADEILTIDGGSGDDTLTGGDGADVFYRGQRRRHGRRQPGNRHRVHGQWTRHVHLGPRRRQ